MATLKGVMGTLRLLTRQNMKLNNIHAIRCYKRWLSPTLKELKRRKDIMGPEPLHKRSNFLDWNFEAEVYAFGKRLNEEFNQNLLRIAFTNRSYIVQEELRQRDVGIENPEINLIDNRELIDQGEKFISKYVEEFLIQYLPKFPKEGIATIHDYLVSENVLSHISLHLGTKDLILSSDFPVENSTLAATLKAVVGALLESSGKKAASLFVNDFVLTQLNGKDVNELWEIKNPMQMLSDILANQNLGPPEPRIVHQAGVNTILAAYQVGIFSNRELIAIGSGENLETATEMAARECLKKFFGTTNNLAPIDFKAAHDVLEENEQMKICS